MIRLEPDSVSSAGRVEGTMILPAWQRGLRTEPSSNNTAGPTGNISLSPLVAGFIPFGFLVVVVPGDKSLFHRGTFFSPNHHGANAFWHSARPSEACFISLLCATGHTFWWCLLYKCISRNETCRFPTTHYEWPTRVSHLVWSWVLWSNKEMKPSFGTLQSAVISSLYCAISNVRLHQLSVCSFEKLALEFKKDAERKTKAR